MGHDVVHARSPGVLPVLQAFIDQNRRFDIDTLDDTSFQATLKGGAGSILAHVTAENANAGRSARHDDVHAADLTMRLLTAVILETLEEIIAGARASGIELMLLKGAASALRYYPEPHLRTMGDVDVLVSETERAGLESRLHALGFEPRSHRAAPFYAQHHHEMPLWHPKRDVWIEVHTRPYPPHSPLASAASCTYDAVTKQPGLVSVGAQSAAVMNHERQLVYTATRWAEMIKADRGIFPLLDAALILRLRDGDIDWNDVYRLCDEPWAASALALMLTYLDQCRMADVPAAVLTRLRTEDRFTNAIVRRLLHGMVTAYVMKGRQTGSILTGKNRRIVWTTLISAKPPLAKLFSVPGNVMFPSADGRRFDVSRVIRRVRTLVHAAYSPGAKK